MPEKSKSTTKSQQPKHYNEPPVVDPFTIKWPSTTKMQQLRIQHYKGQQSHSKLNIKNNIQLNNRLGKYQRMSIYTLCSLNIIAVTILGWFLFKQTVGGLLFSNLEIILVIGAIWNLWWAQSKFTPEQQHSYYNEIEDDEFDKLGEEDFTKF
ncbi:MAG: hypothetical protein B6I36_03645 [Desulfobacteraceae bacterium 4572_35.1]|nr:MAG: hypothetical protein B6I36_03645 [Desulfobacteraceae bacterium 4572_35.1]